MNDYYDCSYCTWGRDLRTDAHLTDKFRSGNLGWPLSGNQEVLGARKKGAETASLASCARFFIPIF